MQTMLRHATMTEAVGEMRQPTTCLNQHANSRKEQLLLNTLWHPLIELHPSKQLANCMLMQDNTTL
eukprot:7160969-Lingulodinium_polyedra.AAC.1